MKKSDGTLTGEVVPYNIVPLDAPALTNAIGTFAETPMFIEASEVGYNPIPNNLPVPSTVSVTDMVRGKMDTPAETTSLLDVGMWGDTPFVSIPAEEVAMWVSRFQFSLIGCLDFFKVKFEVVHEYARTQWNISG
ncbi:hypothetical protein GIB67_015401 [Kingdonia uniflora]|uniref:Uncharacterized protein n=1 Tax=Kingdonia uniflora TaxID=39325 RepID=A0A7J7KYY9_9MAGN|nr:hypothetical protein GIB67_015401 [Kingdonia uniflora]